MMTRLPALVAFTALTSACGGSAPQAPRDVEFGAYRLQVAVPKGWDLLDHGRQKRFRQRELEIVLEHLAPPSTDSPAPDDPAARALAAIGHDERRREVKSRQAATLDGREAIDLETWNRLDHTNPQRLCLMIDNDELFALYTVRMATDETLEAFESIRASVHFVAIARR